MTTDVFPPDVGGSGELLRNIYCRLQDIPVTVLAHGRSADVAPGDSDLKVIRRPTRSAAWGVLSPAGLASHLRRAARLRRLCAGSPTVIHCGRALPEGLGAWMASRLSRTRFLCWTHGEELAETSSSRELTALFGVAQRHADFLVANSRHTAGLLEARGLDSGRIRIVYPGVDANRFRPKVPGQDELRAQLASPDELILLTIGRLQRRKGHDLVLRALSQSPDREVIRYVIVGDGEERQRLKALADELRVTDRVRFVGKVPSDDLPKYYAAADIFAHPNRVDGQDFEGFGIVFLEAAAAELPVIAGRSGGVPEAVAADRTGMLVSGTDAAELQAAISALVADPDRRRSMGRAGRVRAREEFSWDRAADRVAELHREVASKIAR